MATRMNYEQLTLFELTEAICETAKRLADGEIVNAEDKLDLAEQMYAAREQIKADREYGNWWRNTAEMAGIEYGRTWRAVLVKAGKRIAEDGRPGVHPVNTGGEFSIKRFAETGDGWITGDEATFDTEHSGQEAWYTPAWVFEGLGLEFDLDVAAPPGGVPWIPARHHYTEDDDGLAQPWQGVVWCNPPYSAPAPWCKRFATHDEMALLIRADLSTGGPLVALEAADALWAPDGRLDFVDGVGERGGSVTFSTVMLGRGDTVVEGMHRLAEVSGVTRELS
jgi:phage N-6-adenine-methyltransferase